MENRRKQETVHHIIQMWSSKLIEKMQSEAFGRGIHYSQGWNETSGEGQIEERSEGKKGDFR